MHCFGRGKRLAFAKITQEVLDTTSSYILIESNVPLNAITKAFFAKVPLPQLATAEVAQ